MTRITLVCNGGYSTSMLVTEMLKVIKGNNLDIIVRAISESRFDQYKYETDILLLAPQVKYIENQFRERYARNNIKIMMINNIDYGMMDGEKVLKDALKLLD